MVLNAKIIFSALPCVDGLRPKGDISQPTPMLPLQPSLQTFAPEAQRSISDLDNQHIIEVVGPPGKLIEERLFQALSETGLCRMTYRRTNTDSSWRFFASFPMSSGERTRNI